jgi:hypothetical protein
VPGVEQLLLSLGPEARRGFSARLPAPTSRGREVHLSVALDSLDLGEKARFAQPPVEERRPMAFLERSLYEVTPEESRATYDQYVHLRLPEIGAKSTLLTPRLY